MRSFIAYLVLAIAFSVTIVLLLAVDEQAQAHTISQDNCRAFASSHASKHGPRSLEHWRADYRGCQDYARRHQLQHICGQPRPLLRYGVTVKHVRAGRKQRKNLTIALNLGRKMGVPRSHQVALVAAATQESSANNLPYGDGSSVGFLQLISDHGKVSWRMKVRNSAGWFLRGARKLDPRGRRSPALLAQDVQGSAHPSAYGQWVGEARQTVRRFYGPCVR